ncbi:rhodanese-like domain-containing protein [Gemella sanguinis]
MKKNKFLAVSMAAVLSLTLVGCSSTSTSTSTSSSDNNTNTVVKAMSGEDLNKIEKDDKEKEKYLVIDVRDAKEYKEGHVKHAINIPHTDIEKEAERISAWKEKPVVVYCNTGKKSKEAAEKLTKAGFKDVSDAKGVKEYKDYELVKFTTLLADQFQAAIDKKEGTFVDIREAKDFEKGHVEGAKNVDVKNIDSELAGLLPADKDAPLYFYCYSGNRSAKAAQKAIELGYTNVYNAWDGAKEHEYKF